MYREVSPARFAENVSGIFPLETMPLAAVLAFFLVTAPSALLLPERDDLAKRVGLAAAMLRNELAPPPGGHHLGAAELDEDPLICIFERLLSSAGAFPLPRPPGRCYASDRGLQPGQRGDRARRGLHGGDHPEEHTIGQGMQREVPLGVAAGCT